MKKIDLNAYGVEAMPKREMQTTDGGAVLTFLLVALIGSIVGGLLGYGIFKGKAKKNAENAE